MPRTETAAISLFLDLDNYGCSKSPALPCEGRQASLVSEELALYQPTESVTLEGFPNRLGFDSVFACDVRERR